MYLHTKTAFYFRSYARMNVVNETPNDETRHACNYTMSCVVHACMYDCSHRDPCS